MANIKYDWNKLRREFIQGEFDTVTNFFKSRAIPITGRSTRKSLGWKKQRDEAKAKLEEQVQGEVNKSLVESEAQVRSRLARLSRTLQYKGLQAINSKDDATGKPLLKVEDIDTARRLITDGIKNEMESLDLNKKPLFTGNVNIAVLQTRYGQMLQGLSYEQLIDTINQLRELHEQRTGGLLPSNTTGSGNEKSGTS